MVGEEKPIYTRTQFPPSDPQQPAKSQNSTVKSTEAKKPSGLRTGILQVVADGDCNPDGFLLLFFFFKREFVNKKSGMSKKVTIHP